MSSVTGGCPTCKERRNAIVLYEHNDTDMEEWTVTVEGNAHRILQCAGCDTVYFQHEYLSVDYDEPFYQDNEDLHVPSFQELANDADEFHSEGREIVRSVIDWPPTMEQSPRPDWSKLSDKALIKHLNSIYVALDNDLRVLAAIGMRVVFDRVSELLDIDPSKSFAKKLNQLF